MPFDESAHPRDETGQFTTGPGAEGKSILGLRAKGASLPKEEKGGGGKGKGKGGKGKKKPKPADKKTAAKSTFAPVLDAAQTKTLQQALAKAGLKGADGKPLKATGKLDADTTAAIKAAQRKYGMKPTGRPTVTLIRRLTKPRMTKTQLARQRPRFASGVPIAGGS